MASAESADLSDQKRALRRAMADGRSGMGAGERVRAAERITERLVALPEVLDAVDRGACVAGFAATAGEIDPARALAELRLGGARVAFPRVSAADEVPAPGVGRPRLHFHVAGPGELQRGRFGILEPAATAPEVVADDIAVMLVPGLAFDARGRRLGFGGGYYDEWLIAAATRRPGAVVGLGYDFQVVDACPAGERDARVDCVVTEARVIRCPDDAVGGALPLARSPSGSRSPLDPDEGKADP
jgi:5-formyltetrahydrofolate cyclo-ligase